MPEPRDATGSITVPERGDWMIGDHNVGHILDHTYRFQGTLVAVPLCADDEFEVGDEAYPFVDQPDAACLGCVAALLEREAQGAEWAQADIAATNLRRIAANLTTKGRVDVL